MAILKLKPNRQNLSITLTAITILLSALLVWHYFHLRRFDVIFETGASTDQRVTAYYKFICSYVTTKCRPQQDYVIELFLDEDPAFNAARFDMTLKTEFHKERDTFMGLGCFTIEEDNLLCDMLGNGSIPVKYGSKKRLND